MLQLNNKSDQSSSSDSDTESDKECKKSNQNPTLNSNSNSNNSNTNNKNIPSPNENRKRKLSNINSSNNNTPTGPPKKRQRSNNLSINTEIENENDTNNNNTNNTTTRNRNKQRKKKKSDKNKNKKKKKRKKSDTPPKKPVENIQISQLECIVCRELPPSKIYQCINSHLLCSKCYNRLCEARNCICPECRIRMSRREPSRNKLAENYLSAHLFDCLNKERGCNDKIQFKYLNEHSLNECKYRLIACKYSILGCQWNGLSKDRHLHNKICQIKKTDPKKILKLVEHINAEKKKLQLQKDEKINKYVSICKLFEMRCRNIICKDIRIGVWNENSTKTEIINSNYFNAMHKRWQFQLKIEKIANPKGNSNNNNNNNNNNCNEKLNKLFIRLQCLTTVRKRIPFEVAVLRGPDFTYELEPIQFECEMNKNKRDSKWIEFIPNNMLWSDEQVKNKFFTNYHCENKINLRVVIMDKRVNGGISREFGDMNDNFEDDIDIGDDFDDIGNRNNNNNNSINSSDSDITSTDSSSRLSTHSNTFSNNSDDDIYSELDDFSSDDYY